MNILDLSEAISSEENAGQPVLAIFKTLHPMIDRHCLGGAVSEEIFLGILSGKEALPGQIGTTVHAFASTSEGFVQVANGNMFLPERAGVATTGILLECDDLTPELKRIFPMRKLDLLIGEKEIFRYLELKQDMIIDLVSACAESLDLHWELEGFKLERNKLRDEVEEELLHFWGEVRRGNSSKKELAKFATRSEVSILLSSTQTAAVLQTVIRFAKGEKVSVPVFV